MKIILTIATPNQGLTAENIARVLFDAAAGYGDAKASADDPFQRAYTTDYGNICGVRILLVGSAESAQ